jgi:restriction system protein
MNNRTIKDVVFEVLETAQKPLSLREIYLRIAEGQLYSFKTENPEQIVRTFLRRHSENISTPSVKTPFYFKFLSDGTFWFKDRSIKDDVNKKLLPTESIPLNEILELQNKHNTTLKNSILSQLLSIDPSEFEEFCKKLLHFYGFKNLEVTRKTRDGGIDGFGELKIGIATMTVAFECKRWSGTVGRPKVSQFRGDIQGKYQQGIFFTTSSFSKEAKDSSLQIGAVPIILIDGESILDIMFDKEFGVEKIELSVYSNALDLILQKDE